MQRQRGGVQDRLGLLTLTDKLCGMEITAAQFSRIESLLPLQRGNVSVSNLQVVNAILYVAEHGCKWRGLPKRFGNWHTIYTRMNRWAEAGVLDRLFEEQHQQLIRVKIEAVSLDSTIVKVHPDGTGALKKRPAVHRQIPRWMDHEDSYGCRGCSNGSELRAFSRPSARCPCGASPSEGVVWAATTLPAHHGSSVGGQRDSTTGAGTWLHSCRASHGHTRFALALQQSLVSPSQRDRAAASSAQRLSPRLQPFRQARHHVHGVPDLRTHRRGLAIVLTGPSSQSRREWTLGPRLWTKACDMATQRSWRTLVAGLKMAMDLVVGFFLSLGIAIFIDLCAGTE